MEGKRSDLLKWVAMVLQEVELTVSPQKSDAILLTDRMDRKRLFLKNGVSEHLVAGFWALACEVIHKQNETDLTW